MLLTKSEIDTILAQLQQLEWQEEPILMHSIMEQLEDIIKKMEQANNDYCNTGKNDIKE